MAERQARARRRMREGRPIGRIHRLLLRLCYQRRGWKVGPWGERYYSGPFQSNDGTWSDDDGWPENPVRVSPMEEPKDA